MIEQLMSLKNITKVNEFIKVFNENVETDLSFQNMLWFAKQAFLGNSSGAKHGHRPGEFCDHAQ